METITSINYNMLVPKNNEINFENSKKVLVIKQKINKILDRQKEMLKYKNDIIKFMLDNLKYELFYDEEKIITLINIYYRFLIRENVSIEECVYLYNNCRTGNNEIGKYIKRLYLMKKDYLIYVATEMKVLNYQNKYIDINIIINELINNYKANKLEIFNPIYNKYKDASQNIKDFICESMGVRTFEELKKTDKQLLDAIKIILFIDENIKIKNNHNMFIKSTKYSK